MHFIFLFKTSVVVVILMLVYCSMDSDRHDVLVVDIQDNKVDSTLTPIAIFEDAFKNKKSNIQVKQSGTIITVLSNDTVGDWHQRLIVRLSNAQTLLIAHNIDLAHPVPNPKAGKALKFYGEYEWNAEGGVVHWTHIDASSVHINGWLEYEGVKYQ